MIETVEYVKCDGCFEARAPREHGLTGGAKRLDGWGRLEFSDPRTGAWREHDLCPACARLVSRVLWVPRVHDAALAEDAKPAPGDKGETQR